MDWSVAARRHGISDKWLLTKKGEWSFCIADLWWANKGVGEDFTTRTLEPGADVAPYHDGRSSSSSARPGPPG